MAASTVSATLYNSSTKTFQVKWSQTSTYGGAARDIKVTDAAGVLYASAGAPTSGDGTAVHTYVLTLYPAGTPGAVSTFTIASNNVAETNTAVSATAVVYALDHAAPYTRADIAALNTVVAQIIADTNLGSYTTLQIADVVLLQAHLIGTSGALLATPKSEDRAYALVDQNDKYRQSTKAKYDYDALAAAVEGMRSSLNARGSLAMSSTGT